jgi:hypothetical protein
MRRRKTIKIDEKEVTVYEVRPRDVMELGDIFEKEGMGKALAAELKRFTDLPKEDLYDMAPSELRQIYDAFMEVNSDFFDMARAVGLINIVKDMVQQIGRQFGEHVAGSLKQAMKTASITDGDTLNLRSKNQAP